MPFFAPPPQLFWRPDLLVLKTYVKHMLSPFTGGLTQGLASSSFPPIKQPLPLPPHLSEKDNISVLFLQLTLTELIAAAAFSTKVTKHQVTLEVGVDFPLNSQSLSSQAHLS